MGRGVGPRGWAVQGQWHEEYESALVTIKKKLHDLEGPEMKEEMMDDIRQWFISHREQCVRRLRCRLCVCVCVCVCVCEWCGWCG